MSLVPRSPNTSKSSIPAFLLPGGITASQPISQFNNSDEDTHVHDNTETKRAFLINGILEAYLQCHVTINPDAYSVLLHNVEVEEEEEEWRNSILSTGTVARDVD
ncbi:hypothetical protein M422DRAFT_276102 [Sphaerobolus stellatus SS14]|uniref:Uncharacterized protein n=1 Tax=Sphaerobolus stellatus (strain SS14) TaxID=990650 RepID=A0A0C9UD22_SPHS4|nr:hypothetical protein M422DRAFT_276102 [Sphaerobolus stellatus SS14]